MQVITEIKDNIFDKTSIALGFFDGVHLAHQKVLTNAIEKARKNGIKSVVVTFLNHPIEVLYDVKPEFITTVDERLSILGTMGFDALVLLDFTKDLAIMHPEKYLQEVLLKPLNPEFITVGYNHHFGFNQQGDITFLFEKSKEFGFELDEIHSFEMDDKVISSTLIRNLIKEGFVDFASKYLGKAYKIRNKVIKGEKRGRQMGYPTLNLEIPENKIIPEFGVYYGLTEYKGKKYHSMINVGLRPTFGDIKTPLIESNLIDFDEEIYGEAVEISFVKKIRNEEKFSSMTELKAQIDKDFKEVKNHSAELEKIQ